MLFIEETSPPPFYQEQLTPAQREQLDKWFIGNRSQAYYLKRFSEFDRQGYLSPKWHWASFFATFGWLLYRKRYLDSIVYTVAGWSFIQLNVAIILSAFEFAFMPFIPDAYHLMTRLIIAAIIWVFWAVMVARWTDAYYYRMARREIADAIEQYPKEPEKQKSHLQREGGVSAVGLSIAFGLFAFLLMVIQVQFLPLYAKPKENGIIQNTFLTTRMATSHIEDLYRVQGRCPVGMSLNTTGQNMSLEVVEHTQALGRKQSSCALIATIRDVPFPNRNLNGQTFIMYRPSTEKGAQWQCVTSLNEKRRPKSCLEEPQN